MDNGNNYHDHEEDGMPEASGALQRDRMLAIVRASGNEQLPDGEKAALWQKIATGMTAVPTRRWWPQLLKAAAILLLVISAGIWWYQSRKESIPSLVAFAAQKQPLSGDSALTRMILGNNRQLVIRNNRASITYHGSGGSLQIDSQRVSQQLKEDKPVFNTLVVPYGNIAVLQLEDGTSVWLNAGSRLVYPAVFSKNKREVLLEGEAYFDVQQEAARPFSVYAADMQVAVLGTAFNISAYKDDNSTQIVLASGSVQLKAFRGRGTDKAPVQLQPGHRAVISAQADMEVGAVDIAAFTSWKDGMIDASHMPLSEILKKLSRYYNQPILTDARSGRETFSGKLNLKGTMNDVLDIIAASTSGKYEERENKIIFRTR
ncbi:FecR family protein [Chitinophaga solisilvae]|uniref:FecR family protein n=1 Tax=Chitinophaga solisilvae TaxID=1233460 RepID=UPI00136CB526|nr:FecR domain-containing protein [Chitinophaga solisilvae]